MTRVRNDLFDGRPDLDRGRSGWVEALWYLLKCAFFLSALPWPAGLKCGLLRRFGAKIGSGVYIKPRVNIHFPWKLEIGDHSWIGEEVFLLNLEPIVIGSHCCISQRAFLCTGNHDFRRPDMPDPRRGRRVGGSPGVRRARRHHRQRSGDRRRQRRDPGSAEGDALRRESLHSDRVALGRGAARLVDD
jgi:hypothetical protein